MRPSRAKSRSFRRVFVKVPGGKTKLHYRRRKVSQPKCAICSKTLHGIKKLTQNKFKNLPKTKKRASRPYSNLCSACMRKQIMDKIK